MKGLKEYKKEIIISMLFTLLPAFIGLILWNRLPETIPTHFNIRGEADQYSSKLFTVLVMPLFLLAVDCISIFAVFNDPKKENISSKNFTLVLWITPLISLYISYLIYGKALNYDIDVTKLSLLLVGIVFLLVGNYLPKCRQNYTIGIKTPWTLNDQDNWDKTHRFGGYVSIVCGFLMIIYAFVASKANIYLLFIIIICVGITPLLYSYFLYKKKQHLG